jgi:hypothetical protein|uniref:Uncharacterized protein n=1 Tax=Zea mays TaxID=4577 RepID=C0PNG9_MAIZE|nr:unknown [Zea mays]
MRRRCCGTSRSPSSGLMSSSSDGQRTTLHANSNPAWLVWSFGVTAAHAHASACMCWAVSKQER